MSKPYREGRGWSIRRRVRGYQVYISGCRTAASAREELDRRVAELDAAGKPFGLGPQRTTLAQGLQDWATQRLPFLKAAPQDVDRINRYLRAGGLATLMVTPHKLNALKGAAGVPRRFDVALVPPRQERPVPAGLGAHRARQAEEVAEAERIRRTLVRLPVAAVQHYHVQTFLDALSKAGRKPATLQLERAVLRSFFNHARRVWRWSAPRDNPATGLRLPKVANGRDRIMSHDEQQRLQRAIAQCRNEVVGPVLRLLTETAMRSSEPLLRATWGDVDWDARLLHLRDGKADARDVPLSPGAIDALKELWRLRPGRSDTPLVQITYESLKAAWQRACARAGVEGLKLHDLRHTAATRFALTTGNVFLVQALTGHKTLSQVARYVNLKASDVVAVMHATAGSTDATRRPDLGICEFRRLVVSKWATNVAAARTGKSNAPEGTGKVVQVDFRKRRRN